MQRIEWVDTSKGIGIALIVYLHVINGLDTTFTGMVTDKAFFYYSQHMIRVFHMPLFFFLSGLFVNRSITRRGKKNFIINKLQTISWPYVLWSFLQGSIHIMFSSYANKPIDFSQLLYSIFFDPYQQFWFLYVLFLYFIVHIIIGKWPVFSIILAFIMYIYSSYAPNILIDRIMSHYIFFIAGSISFNFMLNIISHKMFKYYSVFLLFFILAKLIFRIEGNAITCLLFTFAGITMILSMAQWCKEKNTFMIQRLGAMSLQIFAAHMLFVAGTRILLHYVLKIDTILIYVVLGTLSGLLIPYVLFVITNRIGFPYLFAFKIPESRITP